MSRAFEADSSDTHLKNPSMLHQKRDGRHKSPRRAGSLHAGSSVHAHLPTAAPIPSSAATVPRPEVNNKGTGDIKSLNDEDGRSAEFVNGSSSASTLPSPASLFSNNHNMSYTGNPSSLHALTPLTSSESSPPGKLPSPRSSKPSTETICAPSAPYNLPDTDISHLSATMTPVQTPPEDRIPVLPTDGKYGVKIYYDPMLDPKFAKLPKTQRHHPHYKAIERKVRDNHTVYSKDAVVL